MLSCPFLEPKAPRENGVLAWPELGKGADAFSFGLFTLGKGVEKDEGFEEPPNIDGVNWFLL